MYPQLKIYIHLAEDLHFIKLGVTFCFFLRTRHSRTNQRSDSIGFLLEKLTVSQLVKKFATLFSNQMFINLHLKHDTNHCLSQIEDSPYYSLDIHFNIINGPYLCALITFHLQIPRPFPIPYTVPKIQFQSDAL